MSMRESFFEMGLIGQRFDWLLTADEMSARYREKQRSMIAEAGYSLPKPRIVGRTHPGRRPIEMTPPCGGQANTSGIRRDFEPGGLAGGSIW